MPSMRSMGFTDSRMMPSSLSMSRMRIADSRASGVRRLAASFMSRSALAPRPRAGCATAMRPDLLRVGLGLGLGAHRRAAVARGRLLRLRPPIRSAARRAPASCAAPIRSMRLRRSAISVSRAVNTRSSSATALARAEVGGRLRLGLGLRLLGHRDGALLLGQLDGLPARDLELPAPRAPWRCAPPRPRAPRRGARAPPPRARRSGRARPPAPGRRAAAPRPAAGRRAAPRARAPGPAARTRARGRCPAPGVSVSRFLLRIWIMVSCSMSLRIFLRRSICSVSRVRPSASKAFDGLKNSMPVWSNWVSDTASSSSPFCSRSAATTACTRLTYSPRFSCISSMVISAATVRSASTNLPSTSSLSVSGSSVRWPSVWAAEAMASAPACTRT